MQLITQVGEGSQGTIYQVNSNPESVMKIVFTPDKQFHKNTLRDWFKEVRLTHFLGEQKIAPKMFSAGLITNEQGGQVAFMEIQKLDVPPEEGDAVCGDEKQEQLYNLFADMTDFGITNGDENIGNIMYLDGRFYIIDLGVGTQYTDKKDRDKVDVNRAFRRNFMVLCSLGVEISGTAWESGSQESLDAQKWGWTCDSIDALVTAMINDPKTKEARNKKFMKNQIGKHMKHWNISDQLKTNIEEQYLQ
jgi:hypothetical protein